MGTGAGGWLTADSMMCGAAVEWVGCTAGNTAGGFVGCAVGCALFSPILFSGLAGWSGTGCSDGKAVGRAVFVANVDEAGADIGSGVGGLEAALGAGCVLGASFWAGGAVDG